MTTTDSERAVEPSTSLVGRARRYSILLIPAAAGLVLRWIAVAVWYPSCPRPAAAATACFRDIEWGDSFYFTTQAQLLADGRGFADPTAWFLNVMGRPEIPPFQPGAGHPPVYTTFLALLFRLGLDADKQRFVFPFVGAAGVVLIGILAWKLAGDHSRRVGLVAASIAATYPMLWINDFRYLSESLYIPIVAGFLLSLYRLWRHPTFANAALAGALLGVIGLTRGEGPFIFVFTVPPLLYGMHELARLRRLKLAGVLVVVTGLVMAPWVLYNLSRFERPVTITSGTGMVLLHGSCEPAFYGDALGYYDLSCGQSLPPLIGTISTEDLQDAEARRQAITYVQNNLGQVPTVVLARAGRVWDIYQPYQNVEYNERLEGRGALPSAIGLWYYWALVPFGISGAILLRRRRVPICPVVGMFAAVTATAMLTFGITRYRVPAEVGLVAFAAIAIDGAVRWLSGRLRGGR